MGKIITVDGEALDTIDSVNFIFAGKQLEDDRTHSNYCIQNESTSQLLCFSGARQIFVDTLMA
eukprot:9754519-Karenia_brevis.AAC.1